MSRRYLVLLALVAVCLFASNADAACKKGPVKRAANVVNAAANIVANANAAVRQVVVGNQLVSLDRLGNVLDRQFLNRNNALLNVNLGRNALADRLLLGL